MGRPGRLYMISILLVATIVLITSGTMAFYSSSTSLTASLETAGYTLKVNESEGEAQTLSDMTLAPGDIRTREIKIDTSGLDTPSVLTVTLSVSASGALPTGFSVSLDGTKATGTDGLTAVKTVDDAQDQVINVSVTAAWAFDGWEDYTKYEDLSISYDVTVVAVQKTGA